MLAIHEIYNSMTLGHHCGIVQFEIGMPTLLFSMVVFLSRTNCQFTILRDASDSPLCAVDPPSYVNHVEAGINGLHCIPAAVVCSWKCFQRSNCSRFNFKGNGSNCELYFYIPIRYSVVASCVHFEVGQSCPFCLKGY